MRFAAAAAAAAGALLLVAVNVSNAGYFPRSWGWIAVILLTCAATSLAVSDRVTVSVFPLAFLVAMAAFAGWVALSATWSESAAKSVREVERDIVYLGFAALVAVAGSRVRPRTVVAAALAGGASIATYALATHLFRDRLGDVDPFAGSRLAAPVGYSNGLGLLVAMTLVLGLGVAVRAAPVTGRALAAATLVPGAAALYFTFSRAAWVTLGIGLLVAALLDPRRLGFVAHLVALAAIPVAAVAIASRHEALTHVDSSVEAAAREGERLTVILIGLVALQACVPVLLAPIAARVRPSPALVSWGNRLLAAASICVAAAALVVLGGPASAADRARDAFVAPGPLIEGDLNRRLFSLSGTGRAAVWRVARDMAREHPVVGTGAGTFEIAWLRERPQPVQVRDAHSLYLETAAELGAIGLVLLLVMLAVPLVGAWRGRVAPFVPAAAGAYASYVAHAAVDWDWELVGVTLLALTCAATVLLTAGGRVFTLGLRWRAGLLAVVLVLTAFALASLVGNRALAEGREQYAEGALREAHANGRLAERLLPWSAEPLGLVGAAEFRSGALVRGRRTLRRAVARDPSDWLAWYRLALASEGRARATALERARALNSLEPLLERR